MREQRDLFGECYVCGAPPVKDADPRNPLCNACLPARGHTVSMQRRISAVTPLVAICSCGWSTVAAVQEARDVAVRTHWQQVIEAAR